MHERNPYTERPDFATLAEKYEHLRPYIRRNMVGRCAIDFKDPRALRELTYALLWVDFGLRLEIPLDTLCPPVPNRLDYVLLVEDLLTKDSVGPSNAAIYGIDIGTGASCIYPLLACKKNGDWKMLALEVEPRSINYAASNVARNNMQSCIQVVRNETDYILPENLLDSFWEGRYDFCMCNPPFYESAMQMREARKGKEEDPMGACTGSPSEMVTEGGEAAFIMRIIKESQKPNIRNRIRWFTTLVGRKEDVALIESALADIQCAEHVVQPLRQAKTVRWVVAWTYFSPNHQASSGCHQGQDDPCASTRMRDDLDAESDCSLTPKKKRRKP